MPIQVWKKDLLLKPFQFCFPYSIVKLDRIDTVQRLVTDELKLKNEREKVQWMSTENYEIIMRKVKTKMDLWEIWWEHIKRNTWE